jgi:hypothetical protein
MLDDQITGLPEFYRLDIRTLDIQAGRSQMLFSKCNPGDGVGLWVSTSGHYRKPAVFCIWGSGIPNSGDAPSAKID